MAKNGRSSRTEVVEISSSERVYDGWSRIDRVTARVRRRDGSDHTLRYEIRDHGSAAAVLPYDPVAGTVLLVRQLRLPVHLAGEDGWILEACAGLVDPADPHPEATVVREAFEETGHRIHDLEAVASVYSSPGSITEKVYLFLAQYQRGTAASDFKGDVDEDIEPVEMTAEGAWRLVEAGKIAGPKTPALIFTPPPRRPGLFAHHR